MRRVISFALAGVSVIGATSLAGCSSMSSTSWDMFKSAPPTVQVRLESNPPGADATTSLGAGCKTPCSVSVPAPEVPFTVAFALPKYQPVSVPVNVIRNPGDFTTPAPLQGPFPAAKTPAGGGPGKFHKEPRPPPPPPPRPPPPPPRFPGTSTRPSPQTRPQSPPGRRGQTRGRPPLPRLLPHRPRA